jgi:hypothetical protein
MLVRVRVRLLLCMGLGLGARLGGRVGVSIVSMEPLLPEADRAILDPYSVSVNLL